MISFDDNIIPDCGPPNILSPEKSVTSGFFFTISLTGNSDVLQGVVNSYMTLDSGGILILEDLENKTVCSQHTMKT